MSPFVPFVTENIYQNLVRNNQDDAPISVHMTSWPKSNEDWSNNKLLEEIDVVQKVVGLARAARSQSGVRIRQPLSRLLVRTPDDISAIAIKKHQLQILEELNIKKIEFIARDAELVSYIIKPNLPKIGKIYGKLIPDIKNALENTNTNIIATRVANGESFEVECNGKKLNFEPDDVLIETKSAEGYSSGEEGGFLTAIDTKLTEVLIKEGIARELIRSVQEARKKSGFDVSDRIILGISGSEIVKSVIDDYRDYIMSETLATEWQVGIKDPIVNEENSLDDASWLIEIKK